jgi:hypothetical protein
MIRSKQTTLPSKAPMPPAKKKSSDPAAAPVDTKKQNSNIPEFIPDANSRNPHPQWFPEYKQFGWFRGDNILVDGSDRSQLVDFFKSRKPDTLRNVYAVWLKDRITNHPRIHYKTMLKLNEFTSSCDFQPVPIELMEYFFLDLHDRWESFIPAINDSGKEVLFDKKPPFLPIIDTRYIDHLLRLKNKGKQPKIYTKEEIDAIEKFDNSSEKKSKIKEEAIIIRKEQKKAQQKEEETRKKALLLTNKVGVELNKIKEEMNINPSYLKDEAEVNSNLKKFNEIMNDSNNKVSMIGNADRILTNHQCEILLGINDPNIQFYFQGSAIMNSLNNYIAQKQVPVSQAETEFVAVFPDKSNENNDNNSNDMENATTNVIHYGNDKKPKSIANKDADGNKSVNNEVDNNVPTRPHKKQIIESPKEKPVDNNNKKKDLPQVQPKEKEVSKKVVDNNDKSQKHVVEAKVITNENKVDAPNTTVAVNDTNDIIDMNEQKKLQYDAFNFVQVKDNEKAKVRLIPEIKQILKTLISIKDCIKKKGDKFTILTDERMKKIYEFAKHDNKTLTERKQFFLNLFENNEERMFNLFRVSFLLFTLSADEPGTGKQWIKQSKFRIMGSGITYFEQQNSVSVELKTESKNVNEDEDDNMIDLDYQLNFKLPCLTYTMIRRKTNFLDEMQNRAKGSISDTELKTSLENWIIQNKEFIGEFFGRVLIPIDNSM